MAAEVKKPRIKKGWRLVLLNEEIEEGDMINNGRTAHWDQVIGSIGHTPAQRIARTGNKNLRYIRKKPEPKVWMNPWD